MTMTSEPRRLVRSVMSSPVVAVPAGSTLRAASRALAAADVGTVVVMDGDTLAGVVSERDVTRALADGADPDEVWVADVMSEQPRYLTVSDGISTAAEIMLAAGIRHLPVLDEAEPVGIVSMRDVMRELEG